MRQQWTLLALWVNAHRWHRWLKLQECGSASMTLTATRHHSKHSQQSVREESPSMGRGTKKLWLAQGHIDNDQWNRKYQWLCSQPLSWEYMRKGWYFIRMEFGAGDSGTHLDFPYRANSQHSCPKGWGGKITGTSSTWATQPNPIFKRREG